MPQNKAYRQNVRQLKIFTLKFIPSAFIYMQEMKALGKLCIISGSCDHSLLADGIDELRHVISIKLNVAF